MVTVEGGGRRLRHDLDCDSYRLTFGSRSRCRYRLCHRMAPRRPCEAICS
jgi:hypothetical protein